MKIPTLHGYIDRRILVNFTADPDVARKIVPAPFMPAIITSDEQFGSIKRPQKRTKI